MAAPAGAGLPGSDHCFFVPPLCRHFVKGRSCWAVDRIQEAPRARGNGGRVGTRAWVVHPLCLVRPMTAANVPPPRARVSSAVGGPPGAGVPCGYFRQGPSVSVAAPESSPCALCPLYGEEDPGSKASHSEVLTHYVAGLRA